MHAQSAQQHRRGTNQTTAHDERWGEPRRPCMGTRHTIQCVRKGEGRLRRPRARRVPQTAHQCGNCKHACAGFHNGVFPSPQNRPATRRRRRNTRADGVDRPRRQACAVCAARAAGTGRARRRERTARELRRVGLPRVLRLVCRRPERPAFRAGITKVFAHVRVFVLTGAPPWRSDPSINLIWRSQRMSSHHPGQHRSTALQASASEAAAALGRGALAL